MRPHPHAKTFAEHFATHRKSINTYSWTVLTTLLTGVMPVLTVAKTMKEPQAPIEETAGGLRAQAHERITVVVDFYDPHANLIALIALAIGAICLTAPDKKSTFCVSLFALVMTSLVFVGPIYATNQHLARSSIRLVVFSLILALWITMIKKIVETPVRSTLKRYWGKLHRTGRFGSSSG